MSTEFKCPQCHSLLYSRRPKICGQCGAQLPPELILTDEQIRTMHEQREGARRLADAFDGPESAGVYRDQPDFSLPPGASQTQLKEQDFSGEFQSRKRKGFWIYMVGYSLCFIPFLLLGFGGLRPFPLTAFLCFVGFMALPICAAWWRCSPICPHCRQNIQICPVVYCHQCGGRLHKKRCTSCRQVDYSWVSLFRPFEHGQQRYMKHCPGCSVYLNSWVPRGLKG